jgi:hypothetical protein
VNFNFLEVIVKILLSLFLLILIVPSFAISQVVLFEDEFDGDLSAWELNAYGQIVPDPLDVSNNALSFSHTNVAGDLFSPVFVLDLNTTYVFSFKYLGNAGGEETGGFIWLIDSTVQNSPDQAIGWATQPVGVDGSDIELIDDGQWHAYQFTFSPSTVFAQPCVSFQIIVEDWSGAASGSPPPNVAGDAFFDDIRLYELGAVTTEAASWGGIKALYR